MVHTYYHKWEIILLGWLTLLYLTQGPLAFIALYVYTCWRLASWLRSGCKTSKCVHVRLAPIKAMSFCRSAHRLGRPVNRQMSFLVLFRTWVIYTNRQRKHASKAGEVSSLKISSDSDDRVSTVLSSLAANWTIVCLGSSSGKMLNPHYTVLIIKKCKRDALNSNLGIVA